MCNSNTYQRNEHILKLYDEWKAVNFDLPDTRFVRHYLKREHNIYLSIATFKRIKKKLHNRDCGSSQQILRRGLEVMSFKEVLN